MKRFSLLGAFLCRFALWFVILTAPWPGWSEAYNQYFRALGRLVFSRDTGRRELTFEALPAGENRHERTRVVIVNRNLMAPDGSGPVRNLDFPARRLGWFPTALLAALTLATPIPWPRRGRALFLGLLAVHVFVLGTLGFFIWKDSVEVALVEFTPFWKTFTDGIQNVLKYQMLIAAPALIWVLVTMRRSDWDKLRVPATPQPMA